MAPEVGRIRRGSGRRDDDAAESPTATAAFCPFDVSRSMHLEEQMKTLRTLLLFALASLAQSCSNQRDLGKDTRFELERNGSGQLVRLDRQTGEIAVLDGSRLVPVTQPDPINEVASLAKPRVWPAIAIQDVVPYYASVLHTSWRDNLVSYRFILSSGPLARSKGLAAFRSFDVLLQDEAGFVLAKFTLQANNMVQALGDDKTPVTFEVSDSVAMSSEAYKRATSWQVHWRRTN
jgi:hypothetical protein